MVVLLIGVVLLVTVPSDPSTPPCRTRTSSLACTSLAPSSTVSNGILYSSLRGGRLVVLVGQWVDELVGRWHYVVMRCVLRTMQSVLFRFIPLYSVVFRCIALLPHPPIEYGVAQAFVASRAQQLHHVSAQ